MHNTDFSTFPLNGDNTLERFFSRKRWEHAREHLWLINDEKRRKPQGTQMLNQTPTHTRVAHIVNDTAKNRGAPRRNWGKSSALRRCSVRTLWHSA